MKSKKVLLIFNSHVRFVGFVVVFFFLNRIFPVVCGGCSTKSLEGYMWNCSSSVLCLILVRYLSMFVLKMTLLVGVAADAVTSTVS